MKVDISKEWCMAMAEKEAEAGDPDFNIPLMEGKMTEEQIKYMVNRFLGWKLPENFSPDNGISFSPIAGEGGPYPFKREPSGTNLFDAIQADAMVRYLVDGLPKSATPIFDHEGSIRTV